MGPAALHVGWLASRVPRGQKELRAGKRLELVMEVLNTMPGTGFIQWVLVDRAGFLFKCRLISLVFDLERSFWH